MLGAGWTLLPGSAQSWKGLNMENIKALSCCHPPTAPTATPAVPHSCIQETEPRRNMQSPGWAGSCSMHRWARAAFPALAEPHRHMHLVTAQSH